DRAPARPRSAAHSDAGCPRLYARTTPRRRRAHAGARATWRRGRTRVSRTVAATHRTSAAVRTIRPPRPTIHETAKAVVAQRGQPRHRATPTYSHLPARRPA